MTRSVLTALLLPLVVGVNTCSADLIISQFSAQRNDRYYVGADKAFVAQGYDLAGVGKSTNDPVGSHTAAWASLITPNFALTVGHYPAGGTISFVNGNDPNAPGAIVTATTAAIYTINNQPGDPGPSPSDLVLVRLAAPVVGINPFSIVADDESALIGQQMFVYGQSNRVGTNNVSGSAGFAFYASGVFNPTAGFAYTYDPAGKPNEAMVNAGDSGGPSFVRDSTGGISLLGLHEGFILPADSPSPFPGSTISVDNYLPYYLTQIQTKITSLGYADILSIHTVRSVPEPGSLALLAVGLGGVAYVGWRRRAVVGDRE